VSVLEVRGLVKRFGATTALDGIDLRVDAGEVRGLLGLNGAGKTTLLRILLGLVRADAGSVSLFGRSAGGPPAERLQGVAGFVEEPAFYPYLSARANLELLAELDDDVPEARIGQVLERAGLRERAGDRVAGFSSGMRQRLAVAAALLRDPRLILLDEPTSGLDPAGIRDVTTLIGTLAGDGVAVVLSSHQIAELDGVCDSFTVLRGGAVAWDGSAAALAAAAPPSAYALATSDDAAALRLAAAIPGIAARPGTPGLQITAAPPALDSYVIALGRHDVAVRRLDETATPIESMFFALTEAA
jgi:ABC-2 type transport system ATP-binding protein